MDPARESDELRLRVEGASVFDRRYRRSLFAAYYGARVETDEGTWD
jgi:hypothetical protein